MNRIVLIRRLAIITVMLTFGVMVAGSWVKATGSGLSCPDWPACYGEWLPPFPSAENNGTYEGEPVHYSQAQILYEWGHRLLVTILGPVLFAYAWLVYKHESLPKVTRALPAAAGFTIVIQIFIGAATVLQGNPAATTTLHLATATIIFGLLVAAMALILSQTRAPPKQRDPPRIIYPGERT